MRALIHIGGFVFLIYILIWTILSAATEAACLAKGYKSGKVDFQYNEYCIKRVDQTDVVVNLYDIY